MGRYITDDEILRFFDAVNSQLMRSGIFIRYVTYSRNRGRNTTLKLRKTTCNVTQSSTKSKHGIQ